MKMIKGIALVQILLLAALLSVFALSISQRAHQQIKNAQLASDQMSAFIDIQSIRSQLLFEMLTKEKSNQAKQPGTDGNNGNIIFSERWNFYGDMFQGTRDGRVKIRIQDQAGLIHVNFLDGDLLKGFLAFHSSNLSGGQQLVDSLLDWQDLDNIPRSYGDERALNIRNGPVPYVAEVKQLVGDDQLWLILKENLTVFRKGPFNPLNSPTAVLSSFVSADAVSKIEQLRHSGLITKSVFKELTGVVEDDDVFLYTSNYLELTVMSSVGESRLEHRYLLQISPYATANSLPVNYIAKKF